MEVLKEYKRTRELLFKQENIHPQSKTIFLDEYNNIHYLETGTGKPLVLIHGGGNHSSEWINILKPLSKQFHLYVVDRPGCGLSDPFHYRGVDLEKHAIDFIRSFMDAIGLKRTLLIGQSMGGYFSICFALLHPERVEKLCLIGAPAGMNRWIPFLLRIMGTKGLNGFLMRTVGKPSVKNVRNLHKQIIVAEASKLSRNYLEHAVCHQKMPGWRSSFTSLLENVLTLRGWKSKYYIGDQLSKLKVPVRFIWGDKDAFEKPETGLKKASSIKDHEFKVVKNAGHSPWLDQPEICVSLIKAMLKDESMFHEKPVFPAM